MSAKRNTVRGWFHNFMKPTQEQFWYLFQSIWFKDEKLPVSQISNLAELLNEKAESETVTQLVTELDGKADKETVTNLTTKVNELIEHSRSSQGLRNDKLLSLKANVPFEYRLPIGCMLFALQPWGEQTIKIGSSATKTDDLGEFTTTNRSVIQVGLLPNRSVWLTSNKSGLVDTIIYKGIVRLQ